MQDDLTDAARWAVKQGWADPKRVGIMGASYGGYATLMGLISIRRSSAPASNGSAWPTSR